MADYPAYGTPLWNTPLKAYLDDPDNWDVVQAENVENGTLTKAALDAGYAPLPAPGRNPLTGMFHADGYGALPGSASDSGPAINSAIVAAAAAAVVSGVTERVYVQGTYSIGTRVEMKTNVRLCGPSSLGAKLKAIAGLATAVIVGLSGDAVVDAQISDLTVDQDWDTVALSIPAIQFTNATRPRVSRVVVQDVGTIGILFSTCTKAVVDQKTRIVNTGLSTTANGFGVLFSGSTDGVVDDCDLIDCRGMSVGGNTAANGCAVTNCRMDKTGLPTTTVNGAGQTAPLAGGILTVASTSAFPAAGAMEVAGLGLLTYTGKTATTFTGCAGGSGTATNGGTVYSGYEHIGFTSDCTDLIAQGNRLVGSRDNGISASGPRASVVGNIINGALYHGVWLSGSDSICVGNQIRNVGSNTGAYGGVTLNGINNCVVDDNRIVDDRGGSALMAHGIKELNPAGGHRYGAGNRITGSTGASHLLLSNTSSYVEQVGSATQTYSASMTPDSATSMKKKITATNGTAFTINNPTNAFPGARLIFDILNSSGGALGAITWGAAFKLAGAFTAPADTKRRTIHFFYDGTDWVEVGRVAADI